MKIAAVYVSSCQQIGQGDLNFYHLFRVAPLRFLV
jgi:hypothetical protein